ncbi:MAG TPA: hypothetical protein VH088_06920 [Terriglobales bacterium]|nr:hypothetical protein [Terriglobales bacterium]
MATRLISSRVTVCGCLVLLLFVSTLQAFHTCGTKTSDAQVSFDLLPAASSASPCLACMLQAAAPILVFTVLLCGLAVRERTAFVQVRPRVLLRSFQLDVRPPPVL